MPSHLHEALIHLFRNCPSLAPELLQKALHVDLPSYTEARIDASDLTELEPATYHADLVVLLYQDAPVYGIVLEVQLNPDNDKSFSWPMYSVGLRARFRCPVCVLVVAANDAVARWAARPLDLGGGNRFIPFVLGPSGTPAVEDANQAQAQPELAVLSAIAHGSATDTKKSLRIALAAIAASARLDESRSALYYDLVLTHLSEAARKALQAMDPAKYEYQSEFARRYLSLGKAEGKLEGKAEGKLEGKAEGKLEGRAELVLKLLSLRFGPLPADAETQVRSATLEQLDAFAERVLTADALDQVLL